MLTFFDTVSVLCLCLLTFGAILCAVEDKNLSVWMRALYIISIFAFPWAIYRIVT